MRRINLVKVAIAAATIGSIAITPGMSFARNGTPDFGTGKSFFSVANTSTTAATVVAAYYSSTNATGTADFTDSGNSLPGYGRRDYDLSTDTPLGTGFVGSVVLSSDQDIIAQSIIDYTRAPITTPGQIVPDTGNKVTGYEATTAPATTLYAPLLYRTANNSLVSRWSVQNTSGTAANIYVNYYNRAGVSRGQQVFPLGPYQTKSVNVGNDAELAGTTFNLDNDGSIVVTSTAPLAGVVESASYITVPADQVQSYALAYTMFTPTRVGTKLYNPAVFRIARPGKNLNTPAQNSLSNARINSAMQIQNTSPSATANVTLTVINRATGAVSLTVPFQIQPLSAQGLNFVLGGSLISSTFNVLGSSFSGSAVIDSDQPIVGTAVAESPEASVGNEQDYAGMYGLVTASDATSTIIVPRAARRCALAGCVAASSIYSWTEASAMQVVNVGLAPTTVSSVDFYPPTGGTTPALTINSGAFLTLNPGANFGLNLRFGGSVPATTFDTLTTNFAGTIRVTGAAGSQLKAVYNSSYSTIGVTWNNAENR